VAWSIVIKWAAIGLINGNNDKAARQIRALNASGSVSELVAGQKM
jgi:hypothetical protein